MTPSLSLDPTLRRLDDCGCCAGVTAATPVALENRPGLSAIAYRVGEHATFLRSMLSALSATPNAALAALKVVTHAATGATADEEPGSDGFSRSRQPGATKVATTKERIPGAGRSAGDDFTVALLDAWAAALDVLTFYQERIANESYLRTATERLSLLHLARLIGYELRPGVAASTRLAFTLESAAGAPEEVVLPAGVRVQSVPGPGESAQTFETVEAITARPAWNAIVPRQTGPQTLSPSANRLWLQGVGTNLRNGDALLLAGAQGGVLRYALRRVAGVTREDAAGRTRVDLEPISYTPDLAPAGITAGVWALRARAAVFGHNAGKKPDPDRPADLDAATEWPMAEPFRNTLTLDMVYDQVQRDSWIVVDRSWFFLGWLLGRPPLPGWRLHLLLQVKDLRTVSRADYGITGRATQLTLNGDWLDGFEWDLRWLRDMAVFVGSEPLALAEAPLPEALPRNNIQVQGQFSDLPPGRYVVLSGRAAGQPAGSPAVSELAQLDEVAVSGGFTTLTFKKDLQTVFDRRTVTINANVALATHGETAAEVLGSGNAAQPNQRFILKGSPLTYTAASTPEGAASTLQVRVNDLLWHEVPSFFGHRAEERIYVTRRADDGTVTVQFGDGRAGARLPSGSENVRAVYRKGIGTAGNVKAGQLTLLLTRPLGLKEVINPFPATGGVDPEAREDARRNAPLTVMTLGRVVSLRDYEDFAHSFPGIAKALATWTWDGQRQGVLLTVAGPAGAVISEESATYISLVEALREAGDPYVPLRVQSYAAVDFALAAQVTRVPDFTAEKVAADLKKALLDAFSFDVRQFGQPVARSEVLAVMQNVPGVVGVDVDRFHRTDQPPGLQQRLRAFLPRPGSGLTVAPAELLTLAPDRLELTVK